MVIGTFILTCCGGDEEVMATCSDGIQNGTETDVDCGGDECMACITCDDGIQNGAEYATDCGGDCPECDQYFDMILEGGENYIWKNEQVDAFGPTPDNRFWINGMDMPVSSAERVQVSFMYNEASLDSRDMTLTHQNQDQSYTNWPGLSLVISLTEFGDVGDYVSGTFEGTLKIVGDPESYPVSGAFRALRQ